MKAYELIEWLNEHHPQKFAEDWDNVGLLVGDDQKEISDESGEQPEGFGRVGKLPHVMTLGEFGKYVKECNHLPDVRVYGDLDRKIETVAICTGSGKSMIGDVMAAGADVYVTGDIDYHTAIDTMADGLAIVDAGHYGTEYIFAEAMEKELNEAFSALKTTCASVKNPYTVL